MKMLADFTRICSKPPAFKPQWKKHKSFFLLQAYWNIAYFENNLAINVQYKK